MFFYFLWIVFTQTASEDLQVKPITSCLSCTVCFVLCQHRAPVKKVRKSLALDVVDCQVLPKSRRKSIRTEIRNSIMVSVHFTPTLPPHKQQPPKRNIPFYYESSSMENFILLMIFFFSVLCILLDRKNRCRFRFAHCHFVASSSISMKVSWIRDSFWVPVTVPFFLACYNHCL